MSNKTLKIIIIILAICTVFNICAIAHVDALLAAPQTNVQTAVLGAVFKDRAYAKTIDVDLVRPPRKAVNPGDEDVQTQTLTNTAEFPIYFRSAYLIRIDDERGNAIENFESNVIVTLNGNWEYRDGYLYYKEMVMPGETISGPIDSIKYSENFDNHRNYRVYVPMVIESVEARDCEIEDVDYWPDEDVYAVDYKRMNEAAEWSVKAEIIIP